MEPVVTSDYFTAKFCTHREDSYWYVDAKECAPGQLYDNPMVLPKSMGESDIAIVLDLLDRVALFARD